MAIPHSVLDYSSIEPYWYRYYLPNDTNSEHGTRDLLNSQLHSLYDY